MHLFSKDENNIYFNDKIIKGADVSSFQVLSAGRAKDKFSFYLGNFKLDKSK